MSDAVSGAKPPFFQLDPIPQKPDGSGPAVGVWQVILNGRLLPPEGVEGLELRNDRVGVLQYGNNRNGPYAQWAFRENGGGGSILIPYAVDTTRQLYVAGVLESRPNMTSTGQRVLCAVGGFKDPGEAAKEAAIRETAEEAGMAVAQKILALPGLPVNANRAFFVADAHAGEGVHLFAYQVPFKNLLPADKVEGVDAWCLGGPDATFTKGSEGVRFVRWNDVPAVSPDALLQCATLGLLGAISKYVFTLVPQT